jgi:hypothetical protein
MPFDAVLFDAAGRAVRFWKNETIETGSPAAVLRVGELAGGMYFLRVESDGGAGISKVVW